MTTICSAKEEVIIAEWGGRWVGAQLAGDKWSSQLVFRGWIWAPSKWEIITPQPKGQWKLYRQRVTLFRPRGALSRLRDAIDRRSRRPEGGIMHPEGGIM